MTIKHLTVRIEEGLLMKLHAVAREEHRSVNGQILALITDLVEAYENKHEKQEVQNGTIQR